ncbi:hypothetical protein LPJ75_006992, partial [Coemansia sp. RSA 2598]
MKQVDDKNNAHAGDVSQPDAAPRESSILDRMVGGGSASSSSTSLAGSHKDAKDAEDAEAPSDTAAPSMPAQARLKRSGSKGKDSCMPQSSFSAEQAEQAEPTWSAGELLEVRARERTFDGAYWRTSLGL